MNYRTLGQTGLKVSEISFGAWAIGGTSEAAGMTGYAADHLALLLRREVLLGERKGRDWFVEPNSLLQYVNAKPKPGPKRS